MAPTRSELRYACPPFRLKDRLQRIWPRPGLGLLTFSFRLGSLDRDACAGSAGELACLQCLGEPPAVTFAEQVDARNVRSDPNGFSRSRQDAIPKNADDALRAMASDDLRFRPCRFDDRHGQS